MIDQKRLDLLLSTATEMGLQPEIINDHGLVSITIDGTERYIFHKSSNPNNITASWLAENKYAARIIFERHGLPNIPFCRPKTAAEAQDFFAEHQKIIAKPIKGKKSQNIHLITTQAALDELNLDGFILEKFIKGQETRFLVVEGTAVSVHLKVYDTEINNPNTVQRVALVREEWDEHLTTLAAQAANAIGLQFAAVDFLVTESGEALLLEINSAPGIDRFEHPDQGPPVAAMKLYLEQLVRYYKH